MILGKVALALVLSQYVRSRVDDRDPSSQCLWWLETTSIVVRQSRDGNPETPGETEFEAIGRSISTWQEPIDRCGNLTLLDGPRTTSRAVGYLEREPNENVALFRQRTCTDAAPTGHACIADGSCGNTFDCWQHAPGAIAITTTSYNPETGRILDSDIEFNTPNFVFSTVDAPPCVSPVFNTSCVATDIENTTTHELGHVLGLGHINIATSTMSPRAAPGELAKRDLDPGSAQFICDVYPKGKPTKTCVLLHVPDELGEPAGCGCASPGAAWVAAAALALARRRARR